MSDRNKKPYTILYAKKVEEKNWWEDLVKKIPTTVTILISVGTFYFGIIQFYYNQNLIDRRKYFNNYYDERFKVLTDLARSTAKINVMIDPKDSLTKTEGDSVRNQLVIFDYARLVLNREKSDSQIIMDINSFLSLVDNYLADDPINKRRRDHGALYDAQIKILEDAGKIFFNEKDSINSFNFKFFPLGKN